MPERDPVVTNPDHATVVSLEAARLNRTTGLRKAVRITSTAAHTEGMYFQSILNDVFEDPEEVIRCVGEPLLMSEATTCEVPTSRVSEVRGDNGVTKLTVAVNPEEYEWLTANLEFFDWDRDAEIIQPGQLLGRYYRLVQATSYILETRGHVDYNADAFADELLVDDHKISLAPNLGNSDTRKDTARLRLAGGVCTSFGYRHKCQYQPSPIFEVFYRRKNKIRPESTGVFGRI